MISAVQIVNMQTTAGMVVPEVARNGNKGEA
jgi:hypothetical protein